MIQNSWAIINRPKMILDWELFGDWKADHCWWILQSSIGTTAKRFFSIVQLDKPWDLWPCVKTIHPKRIVSSWNIKISSIPDVVSWCLVTHTKPTQPSCTTGHAPEIPAASPWLNHKRLWWALFLCCSIEVPLIFQARSSVYKSATREVWVLQLP